MRTFVIGDPQASFAQVLAVLAHAGALAGDRLAPDVVLVSIGDHFDYDLNDPQGAGAEGLRVLRWLASHGDQVRLLFGNHDAARVMELIGLDDTRFASARAHAARDPEGFPAAFPDVPTAGLALRDYASYTTEQRALVIELLLAGRFHLALAGALDDGRDVLLTHAAVTTRELARAKLPDERDAGAIAARLEAHLATAIDAVRADWTRGVYTPLNLEPLHTAGSTGQEGSGLLYHRPANPDRVGADKSWEFSEATPRRFDPRELPVGLSQVAGHTGHRKCLKELGDWPSEAARARSHGGLRTLRHDGTGVRYEPGLLPRSATPVGEVILVDGELRHVEPGDYTLLSLVRLL